MKPTRSAADHEKAGTGELPSEKDGLNSSTRKPDAEVKIGNSELAEIDIDLKNYSLAFFRACRRLIEPASTANHYREPTS